MAETALQTQYLQEYIAGFERKQSYLRQSVTTATEIKGNTAVFLVADSGSASAVTRGSNGLIPARADNNTQNSCTLAEWHDLVRKPEFNIFAGQGNQRAIMQDTTMAVMNRKIDADIIASLDDTTQDTGAAVTASLDLVMYAQTILLNNDVPLDGNITALITPAFRAYLMQCKEFGSAEYVNNKPFSGLPTMFRWADVNWLVHTGLTGKGTNAEVCIMYHKNAIGHACDVQNIKTAIGYDAEQDYSFCRASSYMGSKLLQASGVVLINHDGSAFASQ